MDFLKPFFQGLAINATPIPRDAPDKRGASKKHYLFFSNDKPKQFAELAVAGAGILGGIIGVILINCNSNRKYLMFSSASGMVLSFAALGIYKIVGTSDSIVVPTICLVAFILIFNMGYGPLCYPMIAELFPDEIKHKAMSIVMVNMSVPGNWQ